MAESSVSELVLDVPLQTLEVKKCEKRRQQRIRCGICNKELGKRAIYKHMRKVHHEEPTMQRRTTLICPEPTCASPFYFRKLLRDHIQECHGVKIESCVKKFSNSNDFEVWKGAVEKETNSIYSVAHGQFRRGKRVKIYGCHRSGIFISKSTGKRKPKQSRKVSRKINGWCPASMDVVITQEGIKVKYWKTHFGHTCEIGRLILTRQEKNEIANKLKEGISFQKILDEVRDSVLEGDVRRIHLLKKKDLYNISRSLNISNKENLLQKDHQDINSWIDSMKALGDDCPVIFYKEKGIEQLKLKSPEFFLVIMTKLQQRMSLCCENTIVCVDCIYHIHTFSYYLITLMTADIYNSGCPLAFCVTNRINNNTISTFYECVKSTVGPIFANLFMTVDKPLFYTEWQKIMGSANNHLLCTWDIDGSWRQKLDRQVSVPLETKVRVYKKLRLIMQDAQYGDFHYMLDAALAQFEEDECLKEFVSYFRSKHKERSELWGNCFRSDSVLHSSMILEQLHRDLHHCYMEGQRMSSIVRVLNLVMEISRDKLSEKLENLPRELKLGLIGNCALIPGNERIEKQRAVQTVVDGATSLVNTETTAVAKTTEVPPAEETCCYVNHKTERVCPPNCKPICSVCCICLHKFTCSCLGFKIFDTCPHIQASVDVLKERCTHVKEQCKTTQSEEITFPNFQNIGREMVVELCEDTFQNAAMEMACEDTSDEDSRAVNKVVDTEGETQQVPNREEVNIENFKSLLLQKVEILHHLLENNTCEPEKYEAINEYFDKIIELL